MEIFNSTPAQEPCRRLAGSTGRRMQSTLWRWWPQTEAALLSVLLSQWRSTCWTSMTTTPSSAKVATRWKFQRMLQREHRFLRWDQNGNKYIKKLEILEKKFLII